MRQTMIDDNPDLTHLKWLAIGYYILSAMSALTTCVLIGFALVGVAFMLGAIEAPPEVRILVGLVVVILESALALLVFTMCMLEMLTGRSLASRRRYRLCFIVACIELLNVPVGTALGIFTIIVLQRPSVRDLFLGSDRDDPRLKALESFADEEESATKPASPDDGAIREGVQ